jgi:hypothetical protein
MNDDAEYGDKQKNLEAIFEIAYTQGLPLSGEHGAIALAQRMSRASFYLIPEAVREHVRQEVEARIDAEREAEKNALAALRLQMAQELERRALGFMHSLMARLEATIMDEDTGPMALASLVRETKTFCATTLHRSTRPNRWMISPMSPVFQRCPPRPLAAAGLWRSNHRVHGHCPNCLGRASDCFQAGSIGCLRRPDRQPGRLTPR